MQVKICQVQTGKVKEQRCVHFKTFAANAGLMYATAQENDVGAGPREQLSSIRYSVHSWCQAGDFGRPDASRQWSKECREAKHPTSIGKICDLKAFSSQAVTIVRNTLTVFGHRPVGLPE